MLFFHSVCTRFWITYRPSYPAADANGSSYQQDNRTITFPGGILRNLWRFALHIDPSSRVSRGSSPSVYDACQLDPTNSPVRVYVPAIACAYVSPSDLYFVITILRARREKERNRKRERERVRKRKGSGNAGERPGII